MHRLNPTATQTSPLRRSGDVFCSGGRYEDAHYDGHRYDDAPRYEDEYMKGDPKGKGLNSKGQAKIPQNLQDLRIHEFIQPFLAKLQARYNLPEN